MRWWGLDMFADVTGVTQFISSTDSPKSYNARKNIQVVKLQNVKYLVCRCAIFTKFSWKLC